MNTENSSGFNQENKGQPRDAAYWAKTGSPARLKLAELPEGALNRSVEGRRLIGPLQGFGPMWQKTYRVRLNGENPDPAEVIKIWKINFSKFWPVGNRFFAPLTGIAPGEVALINAAMPGGITLSTGILVLYADEESFTLMTPQGHVFAGWVTFSAYTDEKDYTIAQVQILMRAPDPLIELGLRLGGHKAEDEFWRQTLAKLAAHFDSQEAVQTQLLCVDRKLQWSQIRNIRYNAMLHSAFYMLSAPARLFRH